MNLRDLRAEFLQLLSAPGHSRRVQSIAEADGVLFLCPVCFTKNGGSVGTHSVICWRPKVPQTIHPIPGRWEFEGTGLDDLTLVAGSSSVLIQGDCNAHFFVRSGQIVPA